MLTVANRPLFAAKAPVAMRKLIDDFTLTDEDAAAIMGNGGHESLGFSKLQEIAPTVRHYDLSNRGFHIDVPKLALGLHPGRLGLLNLAIRCLQIDPRGHLFRAIDRPSGLRAHSRIYERVQSADKPLGLVGSGDGCRYSLRAAT